jgi:hypothetical protein
VSDSATEFASIKAMHSSATLHTENKVPVILLPEFKFRAGGRSVEMTLLLHPAQHSGYVTRLFFEQKLEGAGQSANWNPHTVLGRTWWAPSWKDVSPEQPWTSMLCAHLRAVA